MRSAILLAGAAGADLTARLTHLTEADRYCSERALEKVSCWYTYVDGREGCLAGKPIHQRRACPPGVEVRFLEDISSELNCRKNYSFNYRASIPTTDISQGLISLTKGYEIPHANIHVCHAATHLACTPFLANNNEDSSHSEVKQANFSAAGEFTFRDHVAFSNFEEHGTKTVLAHFRYYIVVKPHYDYDFACGDKTKNVMKIDVAIGTPQHTNKENSKTNRLL